MSIQLLINELTTHVHPAAAIGIKDYREVMHSDSLYENHIVLFFGSENSRYIAAIEPFLLWGFRPVPWVIAFTYK